MGFNEIINYLVLPFGGVSVVLVALSTFLGNIFSKRIINGELAQHKLELANLRSEQEVKMAGIKSENELKTEGMKQEYLQKIEASRNENSYNLESLKNELQKELMKYEVYSSMSKEKFQELFQKRIDVYVNLLSLKNEIDQSTNDDISSHFFMDGDPQPFANIVKKINVATRENLMLISNELALLSEKLFVESSPIFTQAKVKSTYIDQRGQINPDDLVQVSIEAENEELDKLHSACGKSYSAWFKQLEKDVSTIRSTLDVAYDYFGNTTNKTIYKDT